MKEYEVEEGEIVANYDDDDTTIDRQIQRLLGHFQKDLEGGISADNLGPRFGVYGSFLPTYQRPPSVLFQSRTPQESHYRGTLRVDCGDNTAKQDSRFSVQESSKFPVKHEVPADQRTFEHQTRVGSDRTNLKSTDFLTESGEVSSNKSDSPTRILQTMTAFPVAGGLLLSPLHEKLLNLSRNKELSPENDKYDHPEVRSSSVDFGGAVSLRKEVVTKVANHKPDQPRMRHTEKKSFEGKKKLAEWQPSPKELTFGDEPPVSPFVIEEDWICCDKCQKWRLLPYGTKPEQLPENWLCSMLTWLPGMNSCDFSEEDTTRALHAVYQILISGSYDVKAHNGREISEKKRKLRDQGYLMTLQCNGNHLVNNDASAFKREVSSESGFKKEKKSKVFQTEEKEYSMSKGEEKSRTRGTVTKIIPGIKDSPIINRSTVERERQTKKYRVKLQSQADFGMIRRKVCKFPRKKAFGHGKEVRTCTATW